MAGASTAKNPSVSHCWRANNAPRRFVLLRITASDFVALGWSHVSTMGLAKGDLYRQAIHSSDATAGLRIVSWFVYFFLLECSALALPYSYRYWASARSTEMVDVSYVRERYYYASFTCFCALPLDGDARFVHQGDGLAPLDFFTRQHVSLS